jgi:hypothetical protein
MAEREYAGLSWPGEDRVPPLQMNASSTKSTATSSFTIHMTPKSGPHDIFLYGFSKAPISWTAKGIGAQRSPLMCTILR